MSTAIVDIDNIVSEIEAGQIQSNERSLFILENAVKDLMSSSDNISDVAVDIPETLLGLNRQQTNAHCSTCQSNDADHILSDRTLFDISLFTSLESAIIGSCPNMRASTTRKFLTTGSIAIARTVLLILDKIPHRH